MSPIEEWAQGAALLLFFVSMFLYVIGVALWNLRLDECPKCDHCQEEKRKRERPPLS